MRAKRNCRENSFAFEENFVYYTKELSRVFMKFKEIILFIQYILLGYMIGNRKTP